MALARFMASTMGRALRVGVGLLLVVIGAITGLWVLALIGLLPIGAGAANFCVLGPVLKAPFWGKDVDYPV